MIDYKRLSEISDQFDAFVETGGLMQGMQPNFASLKKPELFNQAMLLF